MARKPLSKKAKETYIPLLGPTCRVMLKFDGPKIVAIELPSNIPPSHKLALALVFATV